MFPLACILSDSVNIIPVTEVTFAPNPLSILWMTNCVTVSSSMTHRAPWASSKVAKTWQLISIAQSSLTWLYLHRIEPFLRGSVNKVLAILTFPISWESFFLLLFRCLHGWNLPLCLINSCQGEFCEKILPLRESIIFTILPVGQLRWKCKSLD